MAEEGRGRRGAGRHPEPRGVRRVGGTRPGELGNPRTGPMRGRVWVGWSGTDKGRRPESAPGWGNAARGGFLSDGQDGVGWGEDASDTLCPP